MHEIVIQPGNIWPVDKTHTIIAVDGLPVQNIGLNEPQWCEIAIGSEKQELVKSIVLLKPPRTNVLGKKTQEETLILILHKSDFQIETTTPLFFNRIIGTLTDNEKQDFATTFANHQ